MTSSRWGDLGVREQQRRQFVAGALEWADRLHDEFDQAIPEEIAPCERTSGADAA